MSAALDILPVWKKGATAYERLMELALLARAYPERFNRFSIVYEEKLPNWNRKLHICDFSPGGSSLEYIESMGLLQAGIQRLWDSSAL